MAEQRRRRLSLDVAGRRVLRRRSLLTLAFSLFSFALLLSAQGQRPVFRAGTVLVTVDAYPQKDGQIVEGLTTDDFEILEDGKPQKVEAFDFVRVEPALTDSARRDPNSVGEANTLAADPRNRVFVAYLDVYHVDYAGSHATRQPLVDGLNRMLAPNDLFGVMTPKMRPRDIAFGRKLQSIEDQLTRSWPWGERFSIVNDPEEDKIQLCFSQNLLKDRELADQVAWELRQRRREDITLTSLEDLVRYLPGLREARTDVLLFTDGWILFQPDRGLAEQAIGLDASSAIPGVYVNPGGRITTAAAPTQADTASCRNEILRLAQIDDARRFRDLVTEAGRRNITFYPINPGGLAAFDTPMAMPMNVRSSSARFGSLTVDAARLRSRVENLRTLAENTDGIAVVDANDLMAGMRRIADDVSAYYLLGYYSTNTKFNGGFRKIEVRMKRPDLKVKARRGYFAPDETRPAGMAVPASPPVSAAAGPLADALAALGHLRSSAELYSYGAVSGTELTIAAEIAGGQMASGKWAQGGDVSAIVTGANGEAVGKVSGKIEAGARGVFLHLPIAAAPAGPWQVAFKVTGGGETIEDRATITRAPATTLLGDPVIYRAAPGPRAPLRPAADFQFRRTERVHIEWPMLRPFDERQARLLSRTGQPLAVSVTLTTPPSLSILSADVNLSPLGAGDYVIEVTASAGDMTERRLIAIRVTQ